CSYAIIEMMANKLPVVVTDIDGLREMVTHGRDGYKISVEFTQDEIVIDQEQLSIYLTKLIEEENHRKELGDKGYFTFKNNFLVSGMITETRQVYKTLWRQFEMANLPALHIIVPLVKGNTELTENEKKYFS